MRSIGDALPPETLQRVFCSLSSCQRHIAACRLVSRRFHDYSSEFLIPRVTFARRLDAMLRLREIVEHPYFRLHVTELVYDASSHMENFATDFEDYEIACGDLCTRAFYDEQNAKSTQTYAQLYNHVCPVVRPWRGVLVDQRIRNTTGMHKGFQNYYRRWLEEKQMFEDGLDSDMFCLVLSRLPKLRRIVFTDFRELAQEGEKYPDVCKRTFGNTLEPRGLCFTDDTMREFTMLFYLVSTQPSSDIRSLSIGGHPYESLVNYWTEKGADRRYLHRPSDPAAMPYDPYWYEGEESIRPLCRKLQQLRLPIAFKQSEFFWPSPSDFEGSLAYQILDFPTPNLVRLSLYALDLRITESEDMKCVRGGDLCLELMLFPHTFHSLQYLELGGWPLPIGKRFEDFLGKHSSTIKEVCLVECFVSEDPSSLGRWAGQNMSLTGVEINITVGSDVEGMMDSSRCWDMADLEALWLAGRPNFFLGRARAALSRDRVRLAI